MSIKVCNKQEIIWTACAFHDLWSLVMFWKFSNCTRLCIRLVQFRNFQNITCGMCRKLRPRKLRPQTPKISDTYAPRKLRPLYHKKSDLWKTKTNHITNWLRPQKKSDTSVSWKLRPTKPSLSFSWSATLLLICCLEVTFHRQTTLKESLKYWLLVNFQPYWRS